MDKKSLLEELIKNYRQTHKKSEELFQKAVQMELFLWPIVMRKFRNLSTQWKESLINGRNSDKHFSVLSTH